MTDYSELVKALRILQDKNSLSYYKRQVCKDAADAIEKLVTLYEKTEMDATNLTGKLAQAEADVERLNLEIDKRIATEIELSNQVDALQAEAQFYKALADEWQASAENKERLLGLYRAEQAKHFYSATDNNGRVIQNPCACTNIPVFPDSSESPNS